MQQADAEGQVSLQIVFRNLGDTAGITVTSATNTSVVFDSTAPSTPTGLTVLPGMQQNVLNWNPNTESDFSAYEIYSGTSPNPTTLLTKINKGTTTYTHTGLTNGTTYYYNIVSVDAVGNKSNVSADVTGQPVGTAINDITFVSTSLYENSSAGIIAGQFASLSGNSSAVFTYSFVGGTGSADNVLFTISGDLLKTTASLNFEAKSSYNVRIRSTDQNGLTFEKPFIITLIDVNEAPTLDAILNKEICSTTNTQTINLTGITAGPEIFQNTTVNVTSNNPAMFTSLTVTDGSSSSRSLIYKLASGATGAALISVMVTDNGGTGFGGIDSFTQTFELTVNALPVIAITSDIGTDLIKGQTAILTATGGVSYSWANANGIISGQNTATLTIKPNETTTYTVTVTNTNGCSSNKSITINIPITSSTTTVSSIKIVNSSPTNASTVNFAIVFGDPVTTIDISAFSLVKTGNVSAALGTPTGSGTTWNVPVNNITGDGSLRLDLTSIGSITPNASAIYNSGESYIIDNTPPSIITSYVRSGVPHTYPIGEAIDFNVTYNGAIVVNTDGGTPYLAIALNTGDVVHATYISSSVNNEAIFRYIVVAGNEDIDGVTLPSTISLNGATIRDLSGNNANLTLNWTSGSNFVYVDGIVPQLNTVRMTSSNLNTSNARSGDVITVTFTSSKPIAMPNVTIAERTAPVTGSLNTWSASCTLQPTDAQGLITMRINFADLHGNLGIPVFTTTNGSSINFDITSPTTPTGLTVNSGPQQNILNWDANTESDLNGYEIYGGTSANPTTLLAIVNKSSTSFTHEGLVNGITYYYRIVAVDAANNKSAYSSDVTSTSMGAQVITFNTLTKVTYGDDDFDPRATSSSGLPITYQSDNTSIATIVAGKVHIIKSGIVNIIAKQGGNSSFTAAIDKVQPLEILRKGITVIADSKAKVYGEIDPTLTYSISPSLENEDTLMGTLTRALGENTGTYVITKGTLNSNTNYTINFIGNDFIVNKKPLIIKADDKVKSQGNANPALTTSYSGFISRENNTVLTTQPILTTSALTNSAAGSYPITISGAIAQNYSITYQNGKLIVEESNITDIVFTSLLLYENSIAGSEVGQFTSISNNPNASYTYSLVAGIGSTDNALFKISGSTIQTAAVLNFETKANYNIRIKSTDQNGLTFEKAFTITLIDVNEVPTIDAIANQNICSTTTDQTINLTGITAGPETTQTTSLSITSNHPAMFSSLTVAKGAGTLGLVSYKLASNATGTAIISVTVKDNGGTNSGGMDSFTQTFNLTVNALPVITIGSDKGLNLIKGETAVLTTTGGITYTWVNTSGIISAQNMATLTVKPNETTTYMVTVTNASGCTEVKSITLVVALPAIEEAAKSLVTNIMSPNGDGVNDNWVVENIELYPKNSVRVVDVSGRLVYSKKNYDNSWDATLKGTPLAEGTYYYIIDFGDGKTIKKGYITILRKR